MQEISEPRNQPVLFPNELYEFPSTRYQGSKAKIVDWIWDTISDLKFQTMLDAFGGTGVVSYKAKTHGKSVTYNDILKFNYYFGVGLIENPNVRLTSEDINFLLSKHADVPYQTLVQDVFKDIYFTEEENQWVDKIIANIYHLSNRYKFALAFFALCQACIIKRPYNLFHRKNLYMRLADTKRSFGNKTTWDRPFEEWFLDFIKEANNAVFDNEKTNISVNLDAVDVPGKFDLVYIDTPYISNKGTGVNYRNFYHFLEGLAGYYSWEEFIDNKSKHRRLIRKQSNWSDKKLISDAFDQLFDRFKNSTIVVSYRSDGIPSEEELIEILGKYKSSIHSLYYGQYTYVLSKNNKSKEILLIGE